MGGCDFLLSVHTSFEAHTPLTMKAKLSNRPSDRVGGIGIGIAAEEVRDEAPVDLVSRHRRRNDKGTD